MEANRDYSIQIRYSVGGYQSSVMFVVAHHSAVGSLVAGEMPMDYVQNSYSCTEDPSAANIFLNMVGRIVGSSTGR